MMLSFSFTFLLAIINFMGLQQSTWAQIIPAKVTHPVVIGRLGGRATLQCLSKDSIPLRLCIWEQTASSIDSENRIVTFGLEQKQEPTPYIYMGDGLANGQCGLGLMTITPSDFQRWRCTLLAKDNQTVVIRGTVLLERSEFSLGANNPSLRDSQVGQSLSPMPRPVITATASGSSIGSGSVSIAPNDRTAVSRAKTAPVQEVEVQSSGLLIVPRKERKLIIF